jgi:hypothetical protein
MTQALQARAEIAKLEGLLDCEPSALAYLEKASPDDLRRVRDQITDVLFDADREALQRIAAASRLIPVKLLAAIGEKIFGPLLCARVAGLLEPSRAVDVACRLPPAFLAEVAVSLDPRRATDVIAKLPTARIVEVAQELLARDELVTMGRFVGYLPDPAIAACVAVVDEPSLLRIAFVLEGTERLPHIFGLLPAERMAGVLEAARRERLWPEALEVFSHLSEPQRELIAELAADLPEDERVSIVEQARALRLTGQLGPLAAALERR